MVVSVPPMRFMPEIGRKLHVHSSNKVSTRIASTTYGLDILWNPNINANSNDNHSFISIKVSFQIYYRLYLLSFEADATLRPVPCLSSSFRLDTRATVPDYHYSPIEMLLARILINSAQAYLTFLITTLIMNKCFRVEKN